MWKLCVPDVDGVQDQIVLGLTRRGGQLSYPITPGEVAAILTLYGVYDQFLGRIEQEALTGLLPDECRMALADAYGQVSKRGRLKDLRKRLFLGVDVCPLCGFGEPTTLDHYLPLSIFPELAIYPRNLIPACGHCNAAKNSFVEDNEARGFVHAYWCVLPEQRFLFANCTIQSGRLNVVFYIDPAVAGPDLAQSLNFQLDRLRLNQRYPRQINSFLFSQRYGILSLMQEEPNADRLRNYLRGAAVDLEGAFGLNDWRSALMYGLAVSDEFCEGQFREYFSVRNAKAE